MRAHLPLIALIACAAPDADLPLDGADDSFLDGKADGLLDGTGVLQLANRLTAGELTDICRVHSLAAGNIVAYRDDQGPYTDLETLDAVPYVGPRAFESLGRCWDQYYKDGGDGGWRAPFGLPEGDVQLAANLIIPAFEVDDWDQIDRTLDEVLDDPSVRLTSVIDHAQCELRGRNPGRVYLECRRRAFRTSLLSGFTYLRRDRSSFHVVAEIASDGTFEGVAEYSDGRTYGEVHHMQVGGRFGADREVRLTKWKYFYITPYGDGWVQQNLQDLVWGADEASAIFRAGTWDRFDEVTGSMVALPGGTARQACASIPDSYAWYREAWCEGERVTEVAPYELDVHEVSRAAYSACVQEGHCTSPCRLAMSVSDCIWTNDHQFYDLDTRPITGLTTLQAELYCAWAGKRLPSSAQWHLAAAAHTYPWGDASPTCARANHAGCRAELAPRASHSSGATAAGIHDLAGNAAEYLDESIVMSRYTAQGWQEDVSFLELRGGSFKSPAADLAGAHRDLRQIWTDADMASFADIGFRCARVTVP